MERQSERVAMLEASMRRSKVLGLGALTAEDERTRGRFVRCDGRDLVNFGSCSYLGLELDERLIEGAVEAVREHGIQFCSSRIFMSSPLYRTLQALMEDIFAAPVVIAPTTTLGHLAALPVLVDSDHAIVMDHQVHSSVQMACGLTRGYGASVEVLPHDDLDALEERVHDLSQRHERVWYMADGIYSMLGTRAPIPRLIEMLDRHPSLWLYVDDAHGMSWCGPRGAGSVLEVTDLHPRMILTTGLGKGFGTGGGVLVLPDEATRERIELCGPTMLFSGPLQPPVLGAAIASARIHLTPEIDTLQAALRDKIDHVTRGLLERDLPLLSPADSPVGFIATGPQSVCRTLSTRMIQSGLFTNTAQFPAAPLRRSGLRFLVTRHLEREDLDQLVEAVDRHWEAAVAEAGETPEAVYERFGLEPPASRATRRSAQDASRPDPSVALTLERADALDKLDRAEWDRMMAERGCLGAGALEVFESVFAEAVVPEHHWAFRYYIVRDAQGDPVLATLFTAALWKADMLSSPEISAEVERKREKDPYHLTQRVFGQGCVLSEGDHLWLREPAASPISKQAISLLLEAVRSDATALQCAMTVLRDVPQGASDLEALYGEAGLMQMEGATAWVVDPVPEDFDALLARLNRQQRQHQRRSVRRFDDRYHVEVRSPQAGPLPDRERRHLHDLYLNVARRGLELNTFHLPEPLWDRIAQAPGWELVLLRPAEEPQAPPVGFFAAYRAGSAYVPLVAGLDYDWVFENGLYRQLLRQMLERARATGSASIRYGFGAAMEKRRFGAHAEENGLFVELDDHYCVDALAQVEART